MSYPHKYSNEDIRRAAHNARKQALRLVIDGGAGYLGQTCSSAEILATLYMKILNLGESLGNPNGMRFAGVPGPGNNNAGSGSLYNGPATGEYDRFFNSLPHYATSHYSILVECGRLNREALANFNKDGWLLEILAGEHSPGFGSTGGSLGQVISVAAGTAHARKLKGESGRVVVLVSDGEMEEGQVWEAVQTAVRNQLDNFIIFADINGQQCEGQTKKILNLEWKNYEARFKAFGAETVVVDGHDIDALTAAVDTPHHGKPLAVLCRTDSATGIPMLERKRANLHFVSFGKDELAEIEAFYAQM